MVLTNLAVRVNLTAIRISSVSPQGNAFMLLPNATVGIDSANKSYPILMIIFSIRKT